MKYIIALLLWVSTTAAADIPITAQAWLVADDSGQVLSGENITDQRSIASITKVMTAMVVLDQAQPLDQRIGGYTRRELIQLAMVRSSNSAADTLCQHYPGGRSACVAAMNSRARQLDMNDTKFVDATGLGVMNVSTGQDLVKLVMAAKQYPELVTDSQQAQVTVGKSRHRTTVRNTNPRVDSSVWISKTGYIRAAGGCIVMMLDTELGRRIVVLLGSANTRTRIPEAWYLSRRF